MTTPAPDHATHDPLLIAAHLDGTLDARDATRVHDWLGGCSACVELRSDLAILASATRSMATPPRPRDFTLTAADAQRARAGGWRRALAVIASPRDSFTKPLAVGLTTLGLAGLVIAYIPSASLFGSAASSGAPAAGGAAGPSQVEMSGADAGASAAEGPANLAPASAKPVTDVNGQAVPGPSVERDTAGEDSGQAGQGIDKQPVADPLATTTAPAGPSILLVISIAMLLTGLALALLRWGARHLGDG